MTPPPNSQGPSDREFGELRGEMKGIGRRIDELAESNAREHAENGARMERFYDEMKEAIEGKASTKWVREHETRLRQVESKWSEGKGAFRLVDVAKGFFVLITPFALYALSEVLR